MVTSKPASSILAASDSTPLSVSSAPHDVQCASGCGKSATLKCPTCSQLNLLPTHFCSQECFKSNWKIHNAIHKLEKARVEYVPPPFQYSGKLRPAYSTPMRSVPESVDKPDYASTTTGTPTSEIKLRKTGVIPVYSKEQIEGVRKACKIGREALDLAHSMIRPGITTEAIDVAVHEFIISQGAYPSPLNYYNFPKAICTSVNETICHGIPDLRKLEDGDIVNVDVSVCYKGYHGDLNETYTVGNVDDESKILIKATYDALEQCIHHVKPGVLVREFGDLITKHVTKFGFSVVRSFVGHGIGRVLHALPDIPHYAKNKAIGTLKAGMMFTIEPMINVGTYRDIMWPDGWTVTTADGKRSAQFEHTMLVTDTGVEVLTARTADSPKLFWEMDATSSSSSSHIAHRAATSFSSSSSSSSSSCSSSSCRSAANESKDPNSKECDSWSGVGMSEDRAEKSNSDGRKKKKKRNKGKANDSAATKVEDATEAQ